MKIVTKTPRKVVLEVEVSNIEKYGFDFVWDEIRDKFPESKFGKFSINESADDIIVFELFNVSDIKKVKSKSKKSDVKKIEVSVLEKEIKKG